MKFRVSGTTPFPCAAASVRRASAWRAACARSGPWRVWRCRRRSRCGHRHRRGWRCLHHHHQSNRRAWKVCLNVFDINFDIVSNSLHILINRVDFKPTQWKINKYTWTRGFGCLDLLHMFRYSASFLEYEYILRLLYPYENITILKEQNPQIWTCSCFTLFSTLSASQHSWKKMTMYFIIMWEKEWLCKHATFISKITVLFCTVATHEGYFCSRISSLSNCSCLFVCFFKRDITCSCVTLCIKMNPTNALYFAKTQASSTVRLFSNNLEANAISP